MNVADPDAAGYIEYVRSRLAADGCEISSEQVGSLRALVGYRSDFLPQMLSMLHIFTVVAFVDEVTGQVVDDFARQAGEFGKARKGALRGLQSGVAVFAVLVSDKVTPDAVAWAERAPRMQFAVRVQPVVVDVTAGAISTSRRRGLWGFAMNGHLRRKLDRYFPEPSAR